MPSHWPQTLLPPLLVVSSIALVLPFWPIMGASLSWGQAGPVSPTLCGLGAVFNNLRPHCIFTTVVGFRARFFFEIYHFWLCAP